MSPVIWSADVEVRVLADMLAAAAYRPAECDEAMERVTPGHFHDPVHSRLWEAMAGLKRSGRALDAMTTAHRMGEDPGFKAWGGASILIDLFDKGSPTDLGAATELLCDLYVRRSLAKLTQRVTARAADTGDATGADILADLEREAAGVAQSTTFSTAWLSIGSMIQNALVAVRARDGRVPYPVGIRDVDEKLGGLNAGETTVIAAWTGMGKTIAGLQIAKANGSTGKGVAYFSLEMTETPMAMRLACDLAYDRSPPAYSGQTTNITIDRAIQGRLQPHEFERLAEAGALAADWPIAFDTRPGLSVAQIEAATRRLHRDWAKRGIEPGPVIIDHIGKVRPTVERRGNVTAETRDVANDLDAMAKRLGVPVVALSQLNRLVENGSAKDKRPTLASIKDSGAVAENARQVIFIYRPEYYYREPFDHEDVLAKAERLAELGKVRNHFYWIIEKSSNGPRAQVLSYCAAECSAVRDWNP